MRMGLTSPRNVAALVGLDEPETLGRIEPLHDPGRHDHSLSLEYSQRQARAIGRHTAAHGKAPPTGGADGA